MISIDIPQAQHPIYLRTGTSDRQVFNQIFVNGEYEGLALDFSPKTMLDGGANIGLAAIYFANRYPDIQILSVEPEPENFEILQRNSAPYKTIQAVQAGLWPRSAHLIIRDSGMGSWAFAVEESAEAVPGSIQALSIADAIQKAGWRSLDMAKLDVEGSERELFNENTESWLPQTRVLIVELHDWMLPGCSEAFTTATSFYPFRTYRSGEYTVSIRTDFYHE